MLAFNNILYSLNKRSEKLFSDQISPFLEPAPIRQAEYLFSLIPGIRFKPNINYPGGEIDFAVLSESEKIALCFQAKGTIAPDSARTVQRVEDRTLEGMKQILRFDALLPSEKEKIVNTAFNTSLNNIEFQQVLLVRSCAGSATGWDTNDRFPIVNYVVLALIIAEMISTRSYSLQQFCQQIWAKQNELIRTSDAKVVYEKLPIGEHLMEFPNVTMDQGFIMSAHTKIITSIPHYETAT